MGPMKRRLDPEKQAKLIADVQREQALRQASYRDQALAIFPHVCARCEREFAGKTLRELTVHHKDHDHSNNPPDGSNWELLCLYCHDEEHQKLGSGGYHGGTTRERHSEPSLGYNPFAGLDKLIKPGEDSSGAK